MGPVSFADGIWIEEALLACIRVDTARETFPWVHRNLIEEERASLETWL